MAGSRKYPNMPTAVRMALDPGYGGNNASKHKNPVPRNKKRCRFCVGAGMASKPMLWRGRCGRSHRKGHILGVALECEACNGRGWVEIPRPTSGASVPSVAGRGGAGA